MACSCPHLAATRNFKAFVFGMFLLAEVLQKHSSCPYIYSRQEWLLHGVCDHFWCHVHSLECCTNSQDRHEEAFGIQSPKLYKRRNPNSNAGRHRVPHFLLSQGLSRGARKPKSNKTSGDPGSEVLYLKLSSDTLQHVSIFILWPRRHTLMLDFGIEKSSCNRS